MPSLFHACLSPSLGRGSALTYGAARLQKHLGSVRIGERRRRPPRRSQKKNLPTTARLQHVLRTGMGRRRRSPSARSSELFFFSPGGLRARCPRVVVALAPRPMIVGPIDHRGFLKKNGERQSAIAEGPSGPFAKGLLETLSDANPRRPPVGTRPKLLSRKQAPKIDHWPHRSGDLCAAMRVGVHTECAAHRPRPTPDSIFANSSGHASKVAKNRVAHQRASEGGQYAYGPVRTRALDTAMPI